MLGWFPNPYDDELIYSLCARYFTKSTSLGTKSTLGKCFKGQRSKLTPDFPSNLEALVEQLHIFEYKNLESLIYNHTPFYYFTNFLITTQKEVVMEEIRKTKTKNLHMSIGQVASTVKESKYFKYCSYCLESDLIIRGESYWRISHQLPSVFVCTDHKLLLHFSSVLYRNKNSKLVSPNESNCMTSALNRCITGNITDENINQMSKIATESKKLLSNDLNFNLTNLLSIYKASLRKKGLITVQGRVRQRDLYREFVSFYGVEFLRYFQSVPSLEHESCWLKTITRKHRISFHPLRHLLLLNFLGIELETVRTVNDEGPFGKGPFPCLNPADENYKKMVVTDLKIKRCTDTGRPIGIFTCSCEFQYTRLGPDIIQEDKFRYRYIRNFGEIWKKKLIEYIEQERLSYRKAAQYLNVDVGTVIKYYKLQNDKKNKSKPVEKSKTVNVYRSHWLTIKEANPACSKTELRNLNKKVYMWLYRNDKAWLNNNSPVQLKKTNLNQRVNWNERDLKILKLIKNYLLTIDVNERPVRLTKRHVAVAIDKLSLIEKKLDKLPLTKEFIKTIFETKSDYQERLKEWKKQSNSNH
ncbi:TnsD family Tn7-like transposition protein [Psychrobacillus sp. NEAU-3TGS]|uniref:TnsD family Tn7-like transposition protein n=1 Tax=Psychrobacillus sp. NEAU-3TGS TaxID=2995412 RepID=UPI002495ECD1|nr:TnsD family Tn7-like transposition protein [Psychrobacillus sp. NEAU-3TGS]MDI2585833.1 TnsD family Tn7-like transposition protein [Psychrobacillus sp. NEAU-3TGS]